MIKFRKFRKKDIRQLANIRNLVFSKFNNRDYFKRSAIKRYLHLIDSNKSDLELLKSFGISQETICYVAEKDNKIVGYIKGDNKRISNLFVLGNLHKRGIGKKLVKMFEKEFKRKGYNEIKIGSSIYAISFY